MNLIFCANLELAVGKDDHADMKIIPSSDRSLRYLDVARVIPARSMSPVQKPSADSHQILKDK